MSDDLHTPVLLSALSDPLKIINDMLHTRKGKKQTKRVVSIAALEKMVRNALMVLGLMPPTYSEALQQLREKALRRAKLTEDQILQKIEERTVARKDKDYEKSDAIRKDLAALGIALMDVQMAQIGDQPFRLLCKSSKLLQLEWPVEFHSLVFSAVIVSKTPSCLPTSGNLFLE
ncbi:cysteine--tRNA ligase [Salix suchowensis]|nr:cysteine--tRNA ligase [Salix suchowensis]